MGLVKTQNCKACGKEFSYPPAIVGRKEYFPRIHCDECTDANGKAAEQATQNAADKRKYDAWNAICPPLYRDTDPERIAPEILLPALAWEFGPKGIGIVGESGIMKTRTAFLVLKGQHFAGKVAHAVSVMQIRGHVLKSFSDDSRAKYDAQAKLEQIRNADITLIDDIGKSKMTDAVEQEIYDILEHRTNQTLPTIWTANASGPELRAMLSPDRGDPIMRRLSEFSEILPKQKMDDRRKVNL
jgi:hypothetical protein